MNKMTAIQDSHLSAELTAWCALQGLEPESADEMIEREDLTEYQLAWLKDFCNRWWWADCDHMWISGRLQHPDTFTEQTTWYKSQEFADLVDTWGKPLIPEGYEAARVEMVNATSWRL